MIRKLQSRFVRIAIFSLTLAMVLVVLAVNLTNRIFVREEMKAALTYIMQESEGSHAWEDGKPAPRARRLISESRWFSAAYRDGERVGPYADHASGTDGETDPSPADAAAKAGTVSGWSGVYLFDSVLHDDGVRVYYFLNCETRLSSLRTLFLLSMAACVGGILLALLIVSLASRRMIRPLIRNMERQKQFITDASHELKTPLTVIRANMDLLRMDVPENPWVISTQKQAADMSRLVENLVYLSRMEEENAALEMKPIRLDTLTEETAEPFQAMAEYTGRTLTVRAAEGLRITGDRPSVERLVTLLCDNALKYAPEGAQILAEAVEEGHQVLLRVSNTVAAPLTAEQCSRMFDRFYRADASRSKEKQDGHGIGLAIARAIMEKHGGSIRAEMVRTDLVRITCAFPRANRS